MARELGYGATKKNKKPKQNKKHPRHLSVLKTRVPREGGTKGRGGGNGWSGLGLPHPPKHAGLTQPHGRPLPSEAEPKTAAPTAPHNAPPRWARTKRCRTKASSTKSTRRSAPGQVGSVLIPSSVPQTRTCTGWPEWSRPAPSSPVQGASLTGG